MISQLNPYKSFVGGFIASATIAHILAIETEFPVDVPVHLFPTAALAIAEARCREVIAPNVETLARTKLGPNLT